VTAARTPRTRAVAALAALAASTSLLGGCQLISPRQTDKMYDAGDGVSVDVGEIQVRNLVVVGTKAGGAGTVSAAVGNPTGEAVTLTFATAEANATAQIPAHSTVDLSKSDTKVVLSKVDQAPGDMTQLSVSSVASGQSPVLVPVVPGTGYYEGLAPTTP